MPYLISYNELFLSENLDDNDRIQWSENIGDSYLFDDEDDARQIREELLKRKRTHSKEIILKEEDFTIMYIDDDFREIPF